MPRNIEEINNDLDKALQKLRSVLYKTLLLAVAAGLVAGLALGMLPTTAARSQAEELVPPQKAITLCATQHDLAADIMTERQAGREFIWVMHEYGQTEWKRAMVKDAFSVPHYLSAASQHQAVRSFAEEVFFICVETISDYEHNWE